MSRVIDAADLFCGAGGTTTGLLAACAELRFRLNLVAVNHWPLAIQTHMRNHPWARHICASLTSIDPPADGEKTLFQCIDAVDPYEAIPKGRLRLLIAAPECTDHSNAKGGRPRSDQSRATAWCILRWAEAVRPSDILVENVPEFRNWGPLGARGKPLKSKRGRLFKAFLASLDALGYRVEWRILNCADYGDPTTRRRLFVRAARGTRRIRWPEPSHAPAAKAAEMGLEPWGPAREIIDWRLAGRSIFGRKKPLRPNTIRRIGKGIEKYWGEWAEPFLVMLYGSNAARELDRPLPTVTAKGGHIGLAEPFLLAMNYLKPKEHDGRYTRSLDEPLPTVTSQGTRFGLTRPFLVRYQGSHPGTKDGDRRVHDIEEPLPVQDTSNRYALAEPFVSAVAHTKGKPRNYPLGRPLPTQTGTRTFQLIEPVVLPQDARGRTRPVSDPLPTVAGAGAISVVEPFLVPQHGERERQEPRSRGISEPVPTVTSHGAGALVQPLLLKYNRTGGAKPVDEPLETVTTRDRFGLVRPGLVKDEHGKLYALDIRFRMLQPHELAAAMSFPPGYQFAGNKGETVKQIGNAVPVRTAKALCKAALAG